MHMGEEGLPRRGQSLPQLSGAPSRNGRVAHSCSRIPTSDVCQLQQQQQKWHHRVASFLQAAAKYASCFLETFVSTGTEMLKGAFCSTSTHELVSRDLSQNAVDGTRGNIAGDLGYKVRVSTSATSLRDAPTRHPNVAAPSAYFNTTRNCISSTKFLLVKPVAY